MIIRLQTGEKIRDNNSDMDNLFLIVLITAEIPSHSNIIPRTHNNTSELVSTFDIKDSFISINLIGLKL
jgi:hypothetical protein